MKSDDFDDLARLEDELARFRPADPSPRLLRRLDAIRSAPADRARPGLRRAAVLVGIAAATVAALLVTRRPGDDGPKPTMTTSPPAVAARPDAEDRDAPEPRFSLLSYRNALTKSPEDFDALLIRDASARPAVAPSPQFAYGSHVPPTVYLEGDF